MSLPRFYCPVVLDCNQEISLPHEAAHHAIRVLRLAAGDPVVLFNGKGGEYLANITHIGKQQVFAEVKQWLAREAESPIPLTLAQAISGGDKMDYTLQKAVELGVGRIQPVESERSVVRLKGERAQKRVLHWQGIINAACEQCGRNRVPGVAAIKSLPDWLADEAKSGSPALKLMLAPNAALHLHQFPRPENGIILLAGPEGGFSAAETEMSKSIGFVAVTLGPRVLRTETAALAALAAIQTLWGDF